MKKNRKSEEIKENPGKTVLSDAETKMVSGGSGDPGPCPRCGSPFRPYANGLWICTGCGRLE